MGNMKQYENTDYLAYNPQISPLNLEMAQNLLSLEEVHLQAKTLSTKLTSQNSSTISIRWSSYIILPIPKLHEGW